MKQPKSCVCKPNHGIQGISPECMTGNVQICNKSYYILDISYDFVLCVQCHEELICTRHLLHNFHKEMKVDGMFTQLKA